MKKIHVIETYMDNRQLNLRLPLFRLNPSCPDPGRWEKINLNFYFHTLWCLERFYEGFQGLHKTFEVRQGRVRIKIYVIVYINLTFWNAMQFTFFFINWDSPHARLNSHYKACNYKKKKHKKIKAYRKSVKRERTFNRCLLTLDFKPFRL